MNNSTRHPVLFIIFNRPEVTQQVFEKIRQARPPRLYIAADGPRASRPKDEPKCKECREIIQAVDWPCKLRTLFRSQNLGSARAIPSAIDWLFSHEERGIVLEDDCLPCEGFFAYCDELLNRYAEDERVWWINGSNCGLDFSERSQSYVFSRYALSWGWASWRRAWSSFAPSERAFDADSVNDIFSGGGARGTIRRLYWRFMLDYAYAFPNWDYRWMFTCWAHKGLACVPTGNLIQNIGFAPGAVHTRSVSDPLRAIPCGKISFPMIGPQKVEAAPKVDSHFERVLYKMSPWTVFRVYVAVKAPWIRHIKHRVRR